VDTHPKVSILSICSGIGGLDLGVKRALRRIGFDPRTVCYVEGEAYAAAVLVKQMEAGELDQAPIWSDLKTFDCEPWRDRVDLVIGGFPCQPFSTAGKQLGDKDPRHLWPDVFRVLAETKATMAFCENVPGFVRRGLRDVIKDLSCIGFNAEWDLYSAEEEGAPHRRERLFLFANTNSARFSRGRISCRSKKEKPKPTNDGWWRIEPSICRVVDGVSNRLDRIRALGNAVVPNTAMKAFLELLYRMEDAKV